MKRYFIAAALLSAVMIFPGCSAGNGTAKGKGTVPDIPFSAEAEISYAGEDCKAQIKRMENSRWEFCLTEPYAAEGLIITVNGADTRLKMYDMESAADISSDTVSMAKAIVSAYDSAASDGAPEGTCEIGAYTVTLDDSNEPCSISADSVGLRVDITKFAVLEREEVTVEREAYIINDT